VRATPSPQPVGGLPTVEVDPTTRLVGANGPVPLLDVFEGGTELFASYDMWHTGRLGERAGRLAAAFPDRRRTVPPRRPAHIAMVTPRRWP
jgi:hypothetical protein